MDAENMLAKLKTQTKNQQMSAYQLCHKRSFYNPHGQATDLKTVLKTRPGSYYTLTYMHYQE